MVEPGKLAPLAPIRLTEEPEPETPDVHRALGPLPEIPSAARDLRVLDFDLETLAAGFADPNWVPQKITCAAWSWIGEDEVNSVITGKDGFFNHELRVERLQPFLDAVEEADILTGHNIVRFDLPIINAELMRAGRPALGPQLVDDSIKLPKSKGLKKGLDNLSRMLGVKATKMPLNWVEWDDAYEEDGWPEVIARCESDVVLHKEQRAAMIAAGWSKPPKWWRP